MDSDKAATENHPGIMVHKVRGTSVGMYDAKRTSYTYPVGGYVKIISNRPFGHY